MSRLTRTLVVTLSFGVVAGAVQPAPAAAQAPPRPVVVKPQTPVQPIFLNGSFGVPLPATDEFTQSASIPFSDEVMSHQSRYQAPSGLFLDGGGGYRFSRWLGGGIAFSRSGGSKSAAFSLSRPSPYAYNAIVTHDATSRSLDQVQRSVHISAVLTPEFGRAYDLMLFVGPSRIYVDQELITGVDIAESFDGQQYDFAINGPFISQGKVCSCAWGYHVGADASRFLTERFGVGGMVRYARATVDLPNAARTAIGAGEATTRFTAGGLSVAGGLRLRLGRPRF